MAILTVESSRSAIQVLLGLARSLRPKQITKNGLVLFPLFFTVNRWWDMGDIAGMAEIVGRGAGALAIFTVITGAVYLLNDVFDIEKDLAHPRKRYRPIAQGIVPKRLAAGAAVFFGLGGVALGFLLGTEFGFTALAYVGLMQAYNLILKSEVILDVMAIAGGFVLRAVAGSFAIDHATVGGHTLELTISPWLYICTALGALFIALAKRRSELIKTGEASERQRATLGQYTIEFLDIMVAVVAPATLVAYALYTFSGGIFANVNVPENNSMMFTIPFVVYGVFRYLFLMYTRSLGESPEEILLTDKPLFLNILAWLFTAAIILLVNN